MGFSLKQALTPPKSIRKFQPKKVGNIEWWKDFGLEVGVPAALGATGLGLVGMGPLAGAWGGVGGAIGGAAGSAASTLGSAGSGALGGLTSLAQGMGGAEGAGGGSNLLKMALGGADAFLNARRGRESDKLRDLGVGQMKTQERTRADLLNRALGLNAQNPNLSQVFADPSNPFALAGTSPAGPVGPGPTKRRKLNLPPAGGSTLGRAIAGSRGPGRRVT